MSILTMNMSSYEIETADKPAYTEEILCTGWNPALALQVNATNKQNLPADLLAADVESFLKRMYVSQG